MRAMVMAAGLGTRLRPLTYEVPKPLVPVANRPVMEQILLSLAKQGIRDIIANLHWFPETIENRFGDGSGLGINLTYSLEDQLLGTAGGVLNVREYLAADGEPFIVTAGDALTDVDFGALVEAHKSHRDTGGVATLVVKRISDVSEFGVIVTDADGRVQGFQEKPDPAEALSDLANCMIYVLEPEIFDYFPDIAEPDFANDVFPALLDAGVPFYVHETEAYWNDVGSLPELLQGNFDAIAGAVGADTDGTLIGGAGDAAATAVLPDDTEVVGPVLIGRDVEVGSDVRLDGPVVVGHGVRIGDGARVKNSVLLPGADVPAGAILVGAIAGQRGNLAAGSA